MSAEYTKEKIDKFIELLRIDAEMRGMKTNGLERFYNYEPDRVTMQWSINGDTQKSIAEYLREYKTLEKIEPFFPQEEPYLRHGRQEAIDKLKSGNKSCEHYLAWKMCDTDCTATLGKAEYYQVNFLYDSKKKHGIGAIDLLSIHKENKKIYLIELKKEENPNALLLAVLEIYTYLKLIDHEKLCNEVKKMDEYKDVDFGKDSVVPVVAIFETSTAGRQLNCQSIINLIKNYGIKVVLLNNNNEKISVKPWPEDKQ